MKRIIMSCFLLLAACNNNQQPAADRYQGRKETKQLEGASAAGYDGTAVRKSVDTLLDKNDDRKQELDKNLKGSGDGR